MGEGRDSGKSLFPRQEWLGCSMGPSEIQDSGAQLHEASGLSGFNLWEILDFTHNAAQTVMCAFITEASGQIAGSDSINGGWKQ